VASAGDGEARLGGGLQDLRGSQGELLLLEDPGGPVEDDDLRLPDLLGKFDDRLEAYVGDLEIWRDLPHGEVEPLAVLVEGYVFGDDDLSGVFIDEISGDVHQLGVVEPRNKIPVPLSDVEPQGHLEDGGDDPGDQDLVDSPPVEDVGDHLDGVVGLRPAEDEYRRVLVSPDPHVQGLDLLLHQPAGGAGEDLGEADDG